MDGGLIIYGDQAWGAALTNSAPWDNPEWALDETSKQKCSDTLVPSQSYMWQLDFGAAVEINAWAFINHNAYTRGLSEFRLTVGAADNGTVWDTQVTSLVPAAYMEPNFCHTFTAVTKRYWWVQAINSTGTGEFHVGAIVLGKSLALSQAPAAPYRTESMDLTKIVPGRGGGDMAVDRGGTFYRRQMVWPLAPTTLADDLEDVHALHGGARHPICFVDHNHAGSNPYACWYMSMESLSMGRVGKGDRRAIRLAMEDA